MTITEPAITTLAAHEPGIYHDALAGLRGSTSGEGRALLLETMAAEAGRAAAAARGIVPADSSDSSLAWEMTAVLLRQLAATQQGLVLHMVGDYDAEYWDRGRDWEDLARASTSREFTAAFAILYGELLDELQHQDEDDHAAAAGPGDPATPALARLSGPVRQPRRDVPDPLRHYPPPVRAVRAAASRAPPRGRTGDGPQRGRRRGTAAHPDVADRQGDPALLARSAPVRPTGLRTAPPPRQRLASGTARLRLPELNHGRQPNRPPGRSCPGPSHLNAVRSSRQETESDGA